jgi:hypothetical protein
MLSAATGSTPDSLIRATPELADSVSAPIPAMQESEARPGAP